MGSPSAAYLILYNLVCCLGWAYVLSQALACIPNPMGLTLVLKDVVTVQVLTSVQLAALLEIVHAAVGLVRSPVVMTFIQVMSRILVLLVLINSSDALESLGGGLMVLSWSLVEVPRYAFYMVALVTGDATKKTPFPLFWLRYTLFTVLYPSGITGEILTYYVGLRDPAFISLMGGMNTRPLLYLTLFVYTVGSPTMILNMASNRKNAFKKRFAKPPPPPRGVVFPKDEKNQRSSTPAGKAIFSTAVGSVNSDKAKAIVNEKKWRFKYIKHLLGLVEEQCLSPKSALQIATSGLEKAHHLFEFVAPDGSSVSLEEAMATKCTEKFFTGFVKGEGAKPAHRRIEIPYEGKTLHGEELKAQVEKWVSYGTIEPSAGHAICRCIDNPQWVDEQHLSGRYFCLLGAGSAMGPFLVLMALGANVIAIDLDRPQIWKRLIEIAKKSCGTLTFPVKVEPESCATDDSLYASSGCNLFTETPMIRDWLMELYPGKPMCVGSYAYLNGAPHVQVSLAMDAICRDLSEERPQTSLAYLCTPTDLHLIPKEAWEASLENYETYSKRLFCSMLHLLSSGKFLRKNARKPVNGEGGDYYLVNGISVAQGPNYALAKRMQHWRAIIARSKGCIVSSNIAPATSTVSVVHKKEFAWAYEGMPYFKPYEIFAPETSNAVMTALLFYDLNDPASSGNPETKLNNPNQLFQFGSFNGGAWRCAYEVDSIGEASVMIYFSRVAKPYIAVVGAVGVAVAVKLAGIL